MKIILDKQIRLTQLDNIIERDKLIKLLGNEDNYILIGEDKVAFWDYNNTVRNEKVYNAYLELDGIVILIDLETRNYISFKDEKEFDHPIFEEITKWVRMKYMKERSRLLRTMRKFRSELLSYELDPGFYQGVHSETFSVIINKQEYLIRTWTNKYPLNKLELEENFSFFLKVCKLVL